MTPHAQHPGAVPALALAALMAAALIAAPARAGDPDTACIQQALIDFGYDPGPVDGVLGARTADTARAFAGDRGLRLFALTADSAGTWCGQLRRMAGGAKFVNSSMIAATPPDRRDAPGCLADPPPGYSREIHGLVDGDPLTLRVSTEFAGAVESLVWRGEEFINIFDHGRQISYAWGMDGWGECLNPTEPGSAPDGFSQSSTSQLTELCSNAPDTLTTTMRPAFWLAPGQSGFCDRGAVEAVNTSPLTDQTLVKTIEIGYRGIDNVIAFDATVTLETDYRSNGLEVPTGYLTHDFTAYYRFNPATGELTEPQSDPLVRPWSFVNASKIPPILATPDGAYAMGAYTADPIITYEILFYDVPNPTDRTNKWNIVAHQEPAPAGDYHYLSFAIVGTLASVQEAMTALYRLHPTDFHPPEGYVDIAGCERIEGWAWDPKTPNRPIEVKIYDLTDPDNRTLAATTTAGLPRSDLPPVLGDNGRHGYSVETPRSLRDGTRHLITAEAVNSADNLPDWTLLPKTVTLACP